MIECQKTRYKDDHYQHQCPHCKVWNDYGGYGLAHDAYNMNYTGCKCGKTYHIPRWGLSRARIVKTRKRKPTQMDVDGANVGGHGAVGPTGADTSSPRRAKKKRKAK